MNDLIERYTVNGHKWCKSSDVEDLERILRNFSDAAKERVKLDESRKKLARIDNKFHNIFMLITWTSAVSAACVYKVISSVGWL